MSFKRAKLRLSSNTEEGYINLEVLDSRNKEWVHCFTINQPIDYPSSMIMAAGTEKHGGVPNYHTVHSLNFWDVEGPTSDTSKMNDVDENFAKAGKKFDFQASDLLHFINSDSDLAHNATRAIDAYNDQLIAHNTRYAKLIGNVFRN